MALKAKVSKAVFDAFDDATKAFYKVESEDSDNYVLDVEGFDDLSNAESALKALREEVKSLTQRAAKFKDVDPDKYKDLMAKAREAEKKAAEAKGDYDAIVRQLRETHANELEALKQEIAQRDKAVERHLRDSAANEAIAKLGGIPRLLLPLVQGATKVIRNDDSGEYSLQVVGADGKPRLDTKGEPMTVEGLVTEMKADKELGGAFTAERKGGSGANPERPAGGGGQIPSDKKSSKDKIASGIAKRMGVGA